MVGNDISSAKESPKSDKGVFPSHGAIRMQEIGRSFSRKIRVSAAPIFGSGTSFSPVLASSK